MDLIIGSNEGGIIRASLAGRMDIQGSLAVDKQMEDLANANVNVAIDVSQVTFLASLGIRTLITCCKILAAKGGNMVLVSPQPIVEKVLVTSGVNTVIPIASDMAAAEAMLSK